MKRLKKRVVHEGLVDPANKLAPLKASCGSSAKKRLSYILSEVTCSKCLGEYKGARR